MIGEISAVASALLWSSSSILIRQASNQMGVLAVNALRAAAAAVFVLGTLFAVGKFGQMADLTLWPVVYLVAAILIGMALGDSLYFQSIALVGVSRALPISYVYPLFTLPIALLVLGETLTVLAVVGTLLVVGGVFLTARESGRKEGVVGIREQKFRYEGTLLALGAAACWALSTSIQKVVVVDMDVFVANTVRSLSVAIFLLALASRSGQGLKMRSYGWRPLLLAGLAGVLSTGVGGLLYLLSIQYAGAAKAASLTAIAPIFAAPMSMVFLKERLTLPLIGGIALSVAGVWLIILKG